MRPFHTIVAIVRCAQCNAHPSRMDIKQKDMRGGLAQGAAVVAQGDLACSFDGANFTPVESPP